MNREAIQFGEYEFMAGDKFQLSEHMEKIHIVDIVKDSGKIFVVLRYGKNNPELVDARRFAYYIVNNVFQPAVEPKYKKGQRFVHQYNNNTVHILAISPAVAGQNNEFVYFCALVSEDGSFAYINVDESYFDRLSEVDVPELSFPEPEIPDDAVLPEVVMYIKPPKELDCRPKPPMPPSFIITPQPPTTTP